MLCIFYPTGLLLARESRSDAPSNFILLYASHSNSHKRSGAPFWRAYQRVGARPLCRCLRLRPEVWREGGADQESASEATPPQVISNRSRPVLLHIRISQGEMLPTQGVSPCEFHCHADPILEHCAGVICERGPSVNWPSMLRAIHCASKCCLCSVERVFSRAMASNWPHRTSKSWLYCAE